jgi:hypothetical protein
MKITIHVKTPKDKKSLEADDNAEIKEVGRARAVRVPK